MPAQSADPTCGGTDDAPDQPAHRRQHPGQPRLRVRRDDLDRHRRPDHQQQRSRGPHGLVEALARRQRLLEHRDGQPVGDRPVHRDRRHAVVLDPHRHRRERLDGVRHHAGAGRDGSTATTLRSFSNVGTNATYTQYSHNLTAYKGKTVTIRFTMTEDSSLQTSFVVDDTALNVS